MSFDIFVDGDFVIAEEIHEESKTGIILPNKKPEPFLRVVSGKYEPGTKILLNHDWPKKFIYKQKEYCIVPYEHIVGFVL